MKAMAFSRRIRIFLAWTARLALLAYVFQLAAADHWQPTAADIVGIEGSSAHAAHCHSLTVGCAEGGGFTVWLSALADLTSPPSPARLEALPALVVAAPELRLTLDEPPRS